MGLKARIRGLEAKAEWLETWGELRKMELAFRMEVAERRLADLMAEKARADAQAAARAAQEAAHAALVASLPPPRPRPPTPPSDPTPSNELLRPPPLSPVNLVKEISSSAGEEIIQPPPVPLPEIEAWTHDPPEHMRIEKVTWRLRTLQDDFDDDEDDEREDDYYDPLSYA